MSEKTTYISPGKFDAKGCVIKTLREAHQATKQIEKVWAEGVEHALQFGYDDNVVQDHLAMRKLAEKEAAALWRAIDIIEKHF